MLTPQDLQSMVLDSLRNGDVGVPQGLTAFTGPGGDFEDIPANKVRTFIITPYRRDGPAIPSFDDLEFSYEVGKIKGLLTDVLGRSDTNTIPYTARDADPNNSNPFGKVLIQYDPAAAWQGRADGSCNTQVAGIELWFEDSPRHRYRDRWEPFPNQILPDNSLPIRSISEDSKDTRLLRRGEVTSEDEEEWKEYETLMRRQGDGSCHLPSKSASVSSTVMDLTTLQTSFVSSLSGGGSTSSDGPRSSTKESPKTTEEPRYSTKEPPASTQAPGPPPTSSKAVSIILQYTGNDRDEKYNSWIFFETSIGSQADGCQVPVLNDPATRWSDPDALEYPPWPHGTFTLTLFGEENCEYLSDGNSAGILHCPAMGEGNNVGCKEDDEKGQGSAITQCLYTSQLTTAYHRAVYCDY
jgi:hypothetical protein